MLATLLTITFILLTIYSLILIRKEKAQRTTLHTAFVLVINAFIGMVFFVQAGLLEASINEANGIKARIVLMKPLAKYREDIAIAETELSKVERLIDRAFDKNNPNVQVSIKDGVKIYSFLGSVDLGSAELGNAQKQKLLTGYIEKQNQIADRLIYIKKLAYGEEYYTLQQQYAARSNSIYDGWLVRLFSVSEEYKPVVNKEYYPYSTN